MVGLPTSLEPIFISCAFAAVVGSSLGGFSLDTLTKTWARRTAAPLVPVNEDCGCMACVCVDSMRARMFGSRGCSECSER